MTTDQEANVKFLETEVLPLVQSAGARALILDAIEAEKRPHEVPALRHIAQLRRDEAVRVAIIPSADR